MRLLQYKHSKIDYNKLKTNKTYRKSVINKLKFWYFYNEYNEETAFYWLYKDIKKRNQIHTYIKYFNIKSQIFKNNRSASEYFYTKIHSKICPECNKKFVPTKKKGICCSSKCANNHKTKDINFILKLSQGVKTSWENLSEEDRNERKHNISKGNKNFYSNLSEQEYKEFWDNWNKSYTKTCHLKYGYCSYFAVPEHINSFKEKRKQTNILRYGGPAPICSEAIKDKVRKTLRKTNEASGKWIKQEDISDFKLYSRIVRKLTEKQPVHLLENFDKRGTVGKEDAYHLDHKIPVKYGFDNNILPYIIADIKNLEMIPAIDNIRKGSKY